MKKTFVFVSLLVLVSLVLSACGTPATPVAPAPTEAFVVTTEPPAPTEPPMPAWTAPEGALVAAFVDAAPTLDGMGDDAAWAAATEIVVPVSGGMNFDGKGGTDVSIKAVYTADEVYFLVTYADPTESWYRSPWQKQEDGTWKKVTDPADKGVITTPFTKTSWLSFGPSLLSRILKPQAVSLPVIRARTRPQTLRQQVSRRRRNRRHLALEIRPQHEPGGRSMARLDQTRHLNSRTASQDHRSWSS